MKDQERRNTIKKYLIVILFTLILSINFVYAAEYPEITNDIEIRYKWYKEVVSKEGEYVPKTEITSNDIVDEQNYRFGIFSERSPEYCNLSPQDYQIKKYTYTTYDQVYDAIYVLIENVEYNNNIKIFYDHEPVDFEIISIEDNRVKINLKKAYLNELLLFFVDTDKDYTISLYINSYFINPTLSKHITGEKISIPDETWITENTTFRKIRTTQTYKNSSLTIKLFEETECKYRDILVYKYDIEREYYDDNYHTNIEGYIKDISDYKIYYKGEPITNTVEIIKEKIVKEPQIEYVYIENENTVQDNLKENDSSSKKTECLPETITEIKTQIQKEIVETEIPKIPKIVYIVILILVITILILIIKLHKKYVV